MKSSGNHLLSILGLCFAVLYISACGNDDVGVKWTYTGFNVDGEVINMKEDGEKIIFQVGTGIQQSIRLEMRNTNNNFLNVLDDDRSIIGHVFRDNQLLMTKIPAQTNRDHDLSFSIFLKTATVNGASSTDIEGNYMIFDSFEDEQNSEIETYVNMVKLNSDSKILTHPDAIIDNIDFFVQTYTEIASTLTHEIGTWSINNNEFHVRDNSYAGTGKILAPGIIAFSNNNGLAILVKALEISSEIVNGKYVCAIEIGKTGKSEIYEINIPKKEGAPLVIKDKSGETINIPFIRKTPVGAPDNFTAFEDIDASAGLVIVPLMDDTIFILGIGDKGQTIGFGSK